MLGVGRGETREGQEVFVGSGTATAVDGGVGVGFGVGGGVGGTEAGIKPALVRRGLAPGGCSPSIGGCWGCG